MSVLASCQNSGHSDSVSVQSGNNDDETKSEGQKKTSKRDYSITRSNSYSDLFLDSLTMEQFIVTKKLNDSIGRRMRSFYNARNYQFAWFTGSGLTEQALAFWNLHDYVTTYDDDTSLRDKALQRRMDALMAEETLAPKASDKSYVSTELTLTEHFIEYVLNNYKKGYVKRKEMERFVPSKKEDPLEVADSLLTKKHKDEKYYENVNQPYKLLKVQLAKYNDIVKQGGWPQVPMIKKPLKPGISEPVVAVIKMFLVH